MEDFDIFIDLVCVRVGTLQTFHEDEFDVDLSYRECDFVDAKIYSYLKKHPKYDFNVNVKNCSYLKNYRICDFFNVEVGKTYRFVFQSGNPWNNDEGLWIEMLDEV